MQQVYRFTGSKNTVVAGLLVQSGRLRNKATHNSGAGAGSSVGGKASEGFVFRVIRNGNVLLDESRAGCDLKRLKTTVHEVNVCQHTDMIVSGK